MQDQVPPPHAFDVPIVATPSDGCSGCLTAAGLRSIQPGFWWENSHMLPRLAGGRMQLSASSPPPPLTGCKKRCLQTKLGRVEFGPFSRIPFWFCLLFSPSSSSPTFCILSIEAQQERAGLGPALATTGLGIPTDFSDGFFLNCWAGSFLTKWCDKSRLGWMQGGGLGDGVLGFFFGQDQGCWKQGWMDEKSSSSSTSNTWT